jgi:hypothetical protein
MAAPPPSQIRRGTSNWQQGLQVHITLPPVLSAPRLLLVWHRPQGNWTPELIGEVSLHDFMPLDTPLCGSWLNMAKSMQRIMVRRALTGQYPQTPEKSLRYWKRPSMHRTNSPRSYVGRQTACTAKSPVSTAALLECTSGLVRRILYKPNPQRCKNI